MKAYVFPGQGAQFTGMGKDLYENSPLAKELFEKGNEILGFRITDIMFEGTAEQLKETKVTQPAVFLHSVILAKTLEDFQPEMVAGHSLGEFSALVANGALSFDDSKFKIYYPDTGLLIASLDEEAQEDLRANKNLGVYKGALYENFVAEAFVKQGLGLYYYKKENATLEEDFFVRTKDELVPVEVKANRNRSKSLRQLISGDSYGDIHWGIKLADSNVGIEDGIYTFPYFCTFLLKRYLRGK